LNHYILGVHIRKNMGENLFYQTPLQVFWDCIDQRRMEISKEFPNKNISIFLSSDFEPAIQQAKQRYKNALIHFHPSTPISREKDSVQQSLMNLWLLSESSEDMVVTEKSTFSHLAYSMKGMHPLEVKYREGKYVKSPKCVRESSSEPKFHLFFRSREIIC
jgi:hypothetical protein